MKKIERTLAYLKAKEIPSSELNYVSGGVNKATCRMDITFTCTPTGGDQLAQCLPD